MIICHLTQSQHWQNRHIHTHQVFLVCLVSFVEFQKNTLVPILQQEPKLYTNFYEIQKNYFDFLSFISEFVRDDKGNPLSLVHYCELFGVPEYGQAHDPEVDAVNLANLYDSVLVKTDLVAEEYKKVLRNNSQSLPYPIAEAVRKLVSGEPVTPEEFEENIKKYVE